MIEPRFLKLIESIFGILFNLSLFFATIVLIYMGIIYITSSENGAKKVHQMIPLFIIGIILIFLSFTIPRLINLFFS